MVLYLGDTQVANVALTDTFNTWRTRFNSAIMDAASISKENAHTAGSTFTGRLSTPKLLANNVTIEVLGDFKGNLSSGTFTSNNYTGNIKTVNEIAANGKVTAPKFIANTLTGTISTAAQPNITSVGTLSGVTLSANVLLGDNDAINFGPAHDLQIVHDGSDSRITDAGTGNLKITSSQVDILGTGETMATFVDNGAVTLYYDNAAKLATKTDGVDITGEIQADSLDIDGNGDISGNLDVQGNLTINGTTTTVSTTNMVVSDNLIELNNGASTNANDSGLVIERGSTGDNAFIGWDESADKFIVGTTTATGASTGNLTITKGTIQADLEGTVTTAAQASITSLGTLTSLTMGGTLDMDSNGITMGGGRINGEGGDYTNLHPKNDSFTTAIDFTNPLHTQVMAASRTITYSNTSSGRSVVVYLDRSASNYTPTWPTTKWANDTEPTWADYRHWLVNLYVRNDGAVLGNASGHAN